MRPYVAAVAVVGGSGSGKTSLISGALPHLVKAGGRIVVIKHAARGYDLAAGAAEGAVGPDKDSARFLEAGAAGVILVAPGRMALIPGEGGAPSEESLPTGGEALPAPPGSSPTALGHALDRAAVAFGRPDLVIVEGFRDNRLPKVFVTGGRAKSFAGAVYAPDHYPAGLLAVARDAAGDDRTAAIPPAIPRFPVTDGRAWAGFLGGLAAQRADSSALSGVVLAGGRSSRLGRNKAFLDFAGQPLIARMAAMLRPLVREVIIVANEPEPYRPYADRVVADVLPGLGPLGGIYAGLLAAGGRAALFAGCDLPFVPAALFERLGREVGEADAAVPFANGEYEPLVAAYSRACLPAVEEAMVAGRRRVVSFYAGVRLAVLAEQEVRAFGDPKTLFFNINSEDDYRRAVALSRGG